MGPHRATDTTGRPGCDCSSPLGESYDEPLLASPPAATPRFVLKLRTAEVPGASGDFGGQELEDEPRSPGHGG